MMDFQSAMETFAEAWVAANTKSTLNDLNAQSEALALTRGSSSSPAAGKAQVQQSPPMVTSASNGGDNGRCTSPHLAASGRAAPPSRTSSTTSPMSTTVSHQHLHGAGGQSTQAVVTTSSAASNLVVVGDPQQQHQQQLLSTSNSGSTGGGGKVNVSSTSPSTPRSHKDDATTFDLSKAACGKSLPVHCVVETIYSVDENSPLSWRRRPIVEIDSYVIIPVTTCFSELVQVALNRLGYSSDSAAAARGSVVIKNWKPLSFDKIADSPLVTVGDVLGELTTVATLKIQVFRARPTFVSDVKDKLLRLLLIQSRNMLLSTGCPLDELTLTQLCRGDGYSNYVQDFTEEDRRKFDQWWTSQLSPSRSHHPSRPQSASQYTSGLGVVPNLGTRILEPRVERSSSLSTLSEHIHPALQTVQAQYPTQKTRMRTSFDPELELPKLQSWFADNQHPSRQQIQQYVKELNGLESRRGRKPLDVNNVVYWFKNARAAQKRAENRGIPPGSLSCHLGVNGYAGNLHSPPNGSTMSLLTPESYLHPDRLIDASMKGSPSDTLAHLRRTHNLSSMSEELSNADSEIGDDDDEQAASDDDDLASNRPILSPVGPLSLTMSKKHDNESDNEPNLSPPHSPTQETVKNDIKMEDNNSHENANENNNHKNDVGDISDIDDTGHQTPEDQKKTQPDDESLYKLDLTRSAMRGFRTPTPDLETSSLLGRTAPPGTLDRLATGFPLVPNSMFSHSIMYMSHYIPGLSHSAHGLSASPSSGSSLSALAASTADERRKRNRTFIDPVTEVPRLEQWFSLSTHPSHNLILKYTEELNRMPYRQKFPRLEPKNVQFWFKNRRAKCKRLKMALYDTPPTLHPQYNCKQESL